MRVASRANTEFWPHSGRMRSHPRIRNPSISLNLRPPEEEIGDATGNTAQYGVETPTPLVGYLLTGALGAIARQELPGGPAPSFRRTRGGHSPISGSEGLPNHDNSCNPRTNAKIPWLDTTLRGVETPTPPRHCKFVWALGNRARRYLPLGPTPRPAAPEESYLPSPNKNSFKQSTTPTTRERNRKFPGSIPPPTRWNPEPQ